MTAPLPPSDTDRIIAAQAEQGHKTRILLVWLLVGLPVAVGLVWLVIVVTSTSGHSSQPTNFTSTVNPTLAPLSGNTITDTTPCTVINAGVADYAINEYANDPVNFVGTAFLNECRDHPDWSAAQALAQAKQDFTAPTG